MATFKWNGGSADWNTPAKWDANGVPGSKDDAFINVPGTNYAVAISQADTVTVKDLTLSASNATLAVDGMLTVPGQLFINAGTVIAKGSLTAGGVLDSGMLAFVGSHVLDNQLISIGGAAGGTLQVQNIDGNTPATLTLNSLTTVQQVAVSATINSTATNGETIINQGHINAQFGDGTMTIAPLNFINQSLINAGNRENLILGGHWTNAAGIIAIATAATLTLAGTFTTADLGTIVGATSINLTGTLNNTGATLAVGRGSPVGTVNLGDTGVISGGTLTDVGGAAFTYTGNGTFNAVTYQGPLNISTRGGRLTVTNGLTVTQSVSPNPGIINVNGGGGAAINFVNSQTIDNLTISLNGADTFTEQVEMDIGGASGSLLTLGSNLTVTSSVTNTKATIRSTNNQSQPALLNKGTMIAAASGGSFTIAPINGFINQGTISISNGDVFSIQPGTGVFNNGGSVSVGSGSRLLILDSGPASPISNTGTITLQSGATLELGGNYTAASLGNIVNLGAVTQIDGTLDAQNGTLALGLGSIVLQGNIHNATIETNNALSAHGGTASLQADAIHGAINLTDAASKLTINEGVTFTGPMGKQNGTINLTGKGDSLLFNNLVAGGGAGQVLDNVTLNIGNASTVDTIAPSFGGGTFTVGTNASIVSATTGALASLSAGPGTAILLKGTLTATGAGGQFTIPAVAGSSFINNGTMIVGNGDTLNVTTAISTGPGSGTIDIVSAGIASFAASVTANQIVDFTGSTGILKLKEPASFAATITDFFIGDTIDFVAIAATDSVWTPGAFGQPGTLALVNATGTTVASLSLLGNYAADSFTVTSDNAGGTAVTTIATCYAAGTRIRTTQGDVAVERLREGDMLVTVSGGTQPICWIGRRNVDFRRHPRPQRVLPIRVAAHAFGDSRPRRSLTLSPDHAVFVEDVLIPIRHLENGTTVARIEVDAITYYHIELPHHDVILAEGMPAETYLDAGARDAFANGGGAIQLHPDFEPPQNRIAELWDTSGYAPLVVAGDILDRARRNLARQASMITAPREACTSPAVLIHKT